METSRKRNPAHQRRLLLPSDAPERIANGAHFWIVLLDHLDRLFFLLDNPLRQRRVRESSRHLLPVGHHPTQKVDENLSLRSIFRLLRDQQPGETGNRISILAWSVGDGDAKIRRHLRR